MKSKEHFVSIKAGEVTTIESKREVSEGKCCLCGGTIGPDDPFHHIERLSATSATLIHGNAVGDGSKLGDNMWTDKKQHPWYLSEANNIGKHGGIEAHHLLSSEIFSGTAKRSTGSSASQGERDAEQLDTDLWEAICHATGYNVNRRENGIFLPRIMALACHLKVPLHFGPHGAIRQPHYPSEVYKLADSALQKLLNGEFCPNAAHGLIEYLDTQSRLASRKISGFHWLLTVDGMHYNPSSRIGCANAAKLSDKTHAVDSDGLSGDGSVTQVSIEVTLASLDECGNEHYSNRNHLATGKGKDNTFAFYHFNNAPSPGQPPASEPVTNRMNTPFSMPLRPADEHFAGAPANRRDAPPGTTKPKRHIPDNAKGERR
jgi:hypothetical protein